MQKNNGQLYLKLRRKGRKFRKKGASKDSGANIKNRVFISEHL